MMADVAAHEYESVRTGGSTRKASYVSNGMARRVKEVKRAVAKEVKPSERSDTERFLIKVDFSKGSSSEQKYQSAATGHSMAIRTRNRLPEWENQDW
jgi:hypothetical protein